MKKSILILMTALFLLGLCGCGKSEEAKRADSLILAIGEVDDRSGDHIRCAEEAVAALTEKQYAELEQLETLEAAKEAYNAIVEKANRAAVDAVEDAIAEIGLVTIDSEEVIAAARRAYYQLDEALQGKVSNYSALIAAEDTYAALLQEIFDAKVAAVEEAIDAIGEIKLDSGDAIAAAKEAYKSSDRDVQKAVSNYITLVSAEKTFSELQIIQAETLIAALEGQADVTEIAAKQMQAATEAYYALNSEQQLQVSNREEFLEIQDTYNTYLETQKAEAAAEAMANVREEPSEDGKFTWIYANAEPVYSDERSFLLPYLCKTETAVHMYLRAWYTGEENINWFRLVINVDGTEFEREYASREVKRETGKSQVWEYYSEPIKDDDIALLRLIMSSEETVISFCGAGDPVSFTVSAEDKGAIYDLIAIYEYQ